MASKNADPGPALLTADVWAAGDGSLQVPLAGLLAADPELQEALLSDEDWQARLTDYLNSPRP